MERFKEVFDISSLDEYELGCLEFVLSSPAYQDVFEPYLLRMKESMQNRLLDRSQERKEREPDDFLAGGVVAITGLLEFFKNIIAEIQMERVAEAMGVKTPEQQYDLERERGQHVPVLGKNEPPYDPAMDF